MPRDAPKARMAISRVSAHEKARCSAFAISTELIRAQVSESHSGMVLAAPVQRGRSSALASWRCLRVRRAVLRRKDESSRFHSGEGGRVAPVVQRGT